AAIIKWAKVPGTSRESGPKPHVWDWASVYEILSIDPSDVLEGTKSLLDWVEAMDNLIRFEKSRDPEGPDGPYGKFMLSHKTFFKNQKRAEELYEDWKGLELEPRKERFEKSFAFQEVRYWLKYNKVESKVESKEYVENMLFAQVARFRGDRDAKTEENKRKSYGGRDDRDSRSKKP
ncbi:hypothetical protein AAF712_016877, partial [Marasmius tenuissimus]